MTSLDQSQNFWNSTESPSIDYDDYGIDSLTDGTYCSVEWDDLWFNYENHIHYPLLLFICVVGCVTNVLNIFIFTRSVMQNPTNLLLSVLAATDFLCVFRKAVDVSLKFHRTGVYRTSFHSYVEKWINETCFYLFHTWSIYMTVAVALWRLLGILRPMQSRYWLSYRSATFTAAIFVGFATLLVPLLFVGTSLELLNSEAQHKPNFSINTSNGNKSTISDPNYVLTQTESGNSLQFWIHSLLIKLVPCFILTAATIQLIMSLRVAAKDRSVLLQNRNTASADHSMATHSNAKYPEETRNNSDHVNATRDIAKQTTLRNDTCPNVTLETKGKRSSAPSSMTKEFIKTTKMLIILLILFLVTELPPGILAFFNGLIDERKFFVQCYMPVRPFLNLNEYISSSVGFFIYFYMSSKFRQTFIQQFSSLFCMRSSKVRQFSSKHVGMQMKRNKDDESPTTSEELDYYEC